MTWMEPDTVNWLTGGALRPYIDRAMLCAVLVFLTLVTTVWSSILITYYHNTRKER